MVSSVKRTIDDNDGYKVLHRFYDPRCIHKLLEIYRSEPTTNRVLNSVLTWVYRSGDRYHYLWSDPEHPMRNIIKLAYKASDRSTSLFLIAHGLAFESAYFEPISLY